MFWPLSQYLKTGRQRQKSWVGSHPQGLKISDCWNLAKGFCKRREAQVRRMSGLLHLFQGLFYIVKKKKNSLSHWFSSFYFRANGLGHSNQKMAEITKKNTFILRRNHHICFALNFVHLSNWCTTLLPCYNILLVYRVYSLYIFKIIKKPIKQTI